VSKTAEDKDIDALLFLLSDHHFSPHSTTVRLLVAERNALREENKELRSRQKAHQDEVLDRVFEIDALRKRIAELEAQPPAASELRERNDTMTRWMDQVTGMLCHSMTHSHDAKQELVTRCDKAIAAMRKGEA
jgi:predicted  nucleic acid-binding Zn-ribbon protein